MAQQMIGVRVAITRYISDEPQPGVVECEFTDAHGRRWSFVEKTAIVSAEDLDARTNYPQLGVIACEIAGRSRDATGRDVILVDTERPWCVESVDGSMRFEVLPTSLVEWVWGSNVEQAWGGLRSGDIARLASACGRLDGAGTDLGTAPSLTSPDLPAKIACIPLARESASL